MGTIAVSIMLSIIFWGFLGWQYAVAVIVCAIVISLLPLNGFEEKKCEKEIPLIKLRGVHWKDCYVIVKGKKATFAMDNKAEYNLSCQAYQERFVKGKIIIYDSEKCEQPIL